MDRQLDIPDRAVDPQQTEVATAQDEPKAGHPQQNEVRIIPKLKATPLSVDNFSLKFDDSFPPPFFEATAEKEHTKINPNNHFT